MLSRPELNSRISYNGHKGTIKYIGAVEGTSGTWLGIEWDDRARGKHSGEKDGRVYFECNIPGTGSFIRPTASVVHGRSFLQALQSKYVESPQKVSSKETVTLGSSSGAIEVEAVGLDRVRSKLAKLEKLRETSLDGEDIAYADPPGEIGNICPNIRGLNLSNNLLSSWIAAAQITAELPKLEILDLSRNHLTGLTNAIIADIHTSFRSLQELRLNNTALPWNEAVILSSALPQLRSMELGYNEYEQLGELSMDAAFCSEITPKDSRLETLNLDSNALSDWVNVHNSLAIFPRLARIILTSNNISTIPFPPTPSLRDNEYSTADCNDGITSASNKRLLSVRHLGLQGNRIVRWEDIAALGEWLPNLESLSSGGNPTAEGAGEYRPLVIAGIRSLVILDGSTITNKERNDSELYYLSRAARDEMVSSDNCPQKYRQWRRLCEKHGVGQVAETKSTSASVSRSSGRNTNNMGESSVTTTMMGASPAARPVQEASRDRNRCSIAGRDTLSRRLITINVYLCERDSGRVNVLANLTSEETSAITSSAESTRGLSLSSVRAPSARDSDSSCGVEFDEARLAAAAVARALHSGNAAHNDSSEQQTAVVDDVPYSQKFQLQVLPTMTLRSFRLKLQKTIASRALPHLDPPPRQPKQTRKGAVGDTSSATPSELPINSTFTAHGCDESLSSSSHPRASASTRLDQGPSLNTSLSPTPGRTRSSDAAKSSSTSNTSPNAHSTFNQLHQLQPRLRPRPQSQSQTQLRAWLVMGPQSTDGVSELDYTGGHDTQDLAWLGVEDGSDVVVWLGS